MLKRRASLLRFLRILETCWQAGIILGELLTDQSDIYIFAVYTTYQQRKLYALSSDLAAQYALDNG